MNANSPECYNLTKKRRILRSGERAIILSVYKYFRQKPTNGGITSVEEAARQAAEATGIAYSTVLQVKKTFKSGEGLSTPRKNRKKERKFTRLDKYDDFTRAAIRRKIHVLYRENDLPTVRKVLHIINSDDDFPNFSYDTLRRLLIDMGFRYVKRKRDSLLIDREDIVSWRHKYLHRIREYRKEGRTIVYTDETWANSGCTKSKAWQDTNIKTAAQAWREGLTTGCKAPSGKGGRVLLVHAGSDTGFINGAELSFIGKKSGDYHSEMDGERYVKYFTEQLLPNIPPNSVIVLDNASYHSMKNERVPTKSSRKCVIQDWLTEKCIPWESSMNKFQLLDILNKVRTQYDESYRIDSLAEAAGHKVLRLPPYHCELNPIELVWSQVKRYIAGKNKKFKLEEVHCLMKEGIRTVSSQQWHNYVEHIIAIENRMWEADGLLEILHDQIVINLEDDSTDNDSSDDNIHEDSDSDLGAYPLPSD